jgi:hypothetical protein
LRILAVFGGLNTRRHSQEQLVAKQGHVAPDHVRIVLFAQSSQGPSKVKSKSKIKCQETRPSPEQRQVQVGELPGDPVAIRQPRKVGSVSYGGKAFGLIGKARLHS